MILKLGEVGALQIVMSSTVLSEIENNLRKKAPGTLGVLALILDRSQTTICKPPTATSLQKIQAHLPHPGDAVILAEAWDSGVDYFVTLDRKHFLRNPEVIDVAPFPIGTPGDFLSWFKSKF